MILANVQILLYSLIIIGLSLLKRLEHDVIRVIIILALKIHVELGVKLAVNHPLQCGASLPDVRSLL